MFEVNGGGNGRSAREIFRAEIERARREQTAAGVVLTPEMESIHDQGRSWLRAMDAGQVVATVRVAAGQVPVIGPAMRAAEAVMDIALSAREFVEGVVEDGSDEMDVDGDGITGGELETIESLGTIFGLSPDQLGLMMLGTTALVPFVGPKALLAGAGALAVPGGAALMVPVVKAVAARTVALAPATILRVAGGKSILAMVLRVLMGLLTAKEIYDILSDLFPSIFPPLWDQRGPAVAVYERGNLVAFARGPVVHAPGSRHPGGRYVRKLRKTGPRVVIIS